MANFHPLVRRTTYRAPGFQTRRRSWRGGIVTRERHRGQGGHQRHCCQLVHVVFELRQSDNASIEHRKPCYGSRQKRNNALHARYGDSRYRYRLHEYRSRIESRDLRSTKRGSMAGNKAISPNGIMCQHQFPPPSLPGSKNLPSHHHLRGLTLTPSTGASPPNPNPPLPAKNPHPTHPKRSPSADPSNPLSPPIPPFGRRPPIGIIQNPRPHTLRPYSAFNPRKGRNTGTHNDRDTADTVHMADDYSGDASRQLPLTPPPYFCTPPSRRPPPRRRPTPLPPRRCPPAAASPSTSPAPCAPGPRRNSAAAPGQRARHCQP